MRNGSTSAGTATVGAYVLDLSVLIRSLRGDVAISARIDSLPQVYVPSIVLGELYFGAYGSPTRPDDAVADVENVERTIAVLSPSAATSRIYALSSRT